MRRKVTKLLVVVTVMALLSGLASFAFADTRTLGKTKEYGGTVSFNYGAGFVLTTEAGVEYKLVLGPPWYLEDLGLKLKQGDKVTVKGVNDENGVLYVGTVKKGARTYEISDLKHVADYSCHGRFERGMMQRHGRDGGKFGMRNDGHGNWNGPKNGNGQGQWD